MSGVTTKNRTKAETLNVLRSTIAENETLRKEIDSLVTAKHLQADSLRKRWDELYDMTNHRDELQGDYNRALNAISRMVGIAAGLGFACMIMFAMLVHAS